MKNEKEQTATTTVLTITGSDSTGGSGVQSDIKIITSLGGYAVSAITSVTVQNTLGIQSFYDLPKEIVSGQIEAIFDDIRPVCVKIGMIRNVEIVDVIVDAIKKNKPGFVIYDPIAVSMRGDTLMGNDVIAEVKNKLLPLCTLMVVGMETLPFFIERHTGGKEIAAVMSDLLCLGPKAVLIQCAKDCTGKEQEAADIFATEENGKLKTSTLFPALENKHGTAGAISSAIATFVGLGSDMKEAVEKARSFMNRQVALAANIEGRGIELYNDFISLINKHFTTSSDVQFYSQKLNVSARYLAQVTKRLAGETPKSIIDGFLLQQSRLLLERHGGTVKETAYSLGFHSQAHFTKFFKKMSGTTPSEYRKALKDA